MLRSVQVFMIHNSHRDKMGNLVAKILIEDTIYPHFVDGILCAKRM
jgi:hypothetical protein